MKLGQHFMIDEKVLKKVADSARLKAGEKVLEVGAGEGALTMGLVKRGADVIAIEKDEKLFRVLKEKFPTQEIIGADALKIDWPPFDKCVSNLPYLISKKFVLKLLQQDFKLAVLVLQSEFAGKLAAKPRDKNYGVVSVCAQLCCDVELLDRIPKNAFKPQPKVESRLVRLTPKGKLDAGFLQFVARMFQRRNRKVGDKRVSKLAPKDFLTIYWDNKQWPTST